MHKKSKSRKILKNLLLLGVSGFIFFTAILIFYLANIKLPDFHSFEDRKMISSTKIYDNTGTKWSLQMNNL